MAKRGYWLRSAGYQFEPLSLWAEHPWNRTVARIWLYHSEKFGPFDRPFTTTALLAKWLEGFVQAPVYPTPVGAYLRRHGLVQKALRPQMAYRDPDGKRYFKPRLLLWTETDRQSVYDMSNKERRLELMRQHRGIFYDDDADPALIPLAEQAQHYQDKLADMDRRLELADDLGLDPRTLGYKLGAHRQYIRHAKAALFDLRQVVPPADVAEPSEPPVADDKPYPWI